MSRPYRIVVGFDGSDGARRALDRAVGLAGYGSRLQIVYVAAGAGSERGDQLLAEVERKLVVDRVYGEAVERVGDPVDQLIAAARDARADLLVVGTSTCADQRLPSGLVSTALVERAPCDVLVAR